MTVPEPSQANRITHFDRLKPRPGRPVEGTVYVKPPAAPEVWWSPSMSSLIGKQSYGGCYDVIQRDDIGWHDVAELSELPADARPLFTDETASACVDANERMGEALVQIGMAAGLPRASAQVQWGAPEILARIAELIQRPNDSGAVPGS